MDNLQGSGPIDSKELQGAEGPLIQLVALYGDATTDDQDLLEPGGPQEQQVQSVHMGPQDQRGHMVQLAQQDQTEIPHPVRGIGIVFYPCR